MRFQLLQDAAVNSGYLTGRVGLTSTSLFSQAGVGWPLETVVGVQPFVDAERERSEGVYFILVLFAEPPLAMMMSCWCLVFCSET